jgi:hypothetical protein
MAEGKGSIVTTVLVLQPVGKVKVIVAVPPEAPMPITVPVDPTVATSVLLLLHTPLPDSKNVHVCPAHNTPLQPLILPAAGFTVTTALAVQPPGAV